MRFLILTLILLAGLCIAPMIFAHTVTVYTQSGCSHCDDAIDYLNKNGINYLECNLNQKMCLKKFNNLGGNGTPLFIIDGSRKIEGFDKSELDAVLKDGK